MDNKRRWAFTDSNAGTRYFQDYKNKEDLQQLNWDAIQARDWRNCKKEKQSEFLVEEELEIDLIENIGCCHKNISEKVMQILRQCNKIISVKIKTDWYY